jgi:hypothetical protein
MEHIGPRDPQPESKDGTVQALRRRFVRFLHALSLGDPHRGSR